MAAIVNKRVFDEVVHCACWSGADANTATLAGNSRITVSRGFVDQIDSEEDGMVGAGGPAAVDQAGQIVRATLITRDILKLIPKVLLGPGLEANRDWVWYGRESGAATWSKASLMYPVPISLSMAFSRGNYAQGTIQAICRAVNDSDTFADLLKTEGGIAAGSVPALVLAASLWKPTAVTYNSIDVYHAMDFTVNANAIVRQDYGDGDVALSAVDISGWQLSVAATLRYAKEYAATDADILAYMLANPLKSLIVTLEGVGTQAAQTLTVKNINWREGGRDMQHPYTQVAATGTCAYVDDDGTTTNVLTGDSGDRLLVFAAA